MKREAEIGVMLPQAKECQKPEAMKRQGKRQNATLGNYLTSLCLSFIVSKMETKQMKKIFKWRQIYLPHRVLVMIYLLYVKFLEHCKHIYSQFSAIILLI